MNISQNKVKAALLTISTAGLVFIGLHEGVKQESYKDPVGIPTICSGHIKGVTLGMKATPEQCQVFLKEDTTIAGKAVGRLVKVPITQNQYDALVSFTFNLGEGNLASSTLLKKINTNQCTAAGSEFTKWNKARVKGKLVVLKGLTIRREAESKLWLSGC